MEVTYKEIIERLTTRIGELNVNEVANQLLIEKLNTEIGSLKDEIARLNSLIPKE